MSDETTAPGDAFQPEDASEYLQIFVDETEEQLDDLVETMLVLEDDPQDEVSLAAAFRLLHSMKGAAGMMGFDQITVLTHHLETRFERLRSGRIQLDRITMNLTLRCIDFLKTCNERLRDSQTLVAPDDLLGELRELEEQTERELLADQPGHSDSAATIVSVEETGTSSTSAPASPDAVASATHQGNSPKSTSSTGLIDYHLVVQLGGDGESLSVSASRSLAQVQTIGLVRATRPDESDLDELADGGSLDIIVATDESYDRMIEMAMVDGVVSVEIRIPRDSESPPLAIAHAEEPSAIDAEKTSAENVLGTQEVGDVETEPVSAAPRPPAESESITRSDAVTKPSPTADSAIATPNKVAETMRVDIDRLDNLMSLAGELVVNRAQFVQAAGDIGSNLRRNDVLSGSREFFDTLQQTVDRMKVIVETSGMDSGGNDDIDWSSTVKQLEAGMRMFQQQMDNWEESRRNLNQLDEAIDQLSRVSDSLQRGVLGTRMVPVGPLFNRFRRVIRDLAIEKQTKVNLELEGETTELDKRMIDALSDPITHLIRNSIDHGMESPERRTAAGKPNAGTVRLSAQHRGNNVFIIVQDDGGGIDDEKIRRRLVERQIVDPQSAQRLSRQEAIDYIWHPGFSTAETITNVSGRGVGMDIVRSKIHELAGKIEVESELGTGTTFTIKLPLTLAIISSLLVEIRKISFAMPQEDVREIVSVPEGDVIEIGDRRTIQVRGDFLPLVDVEEIFHWHDIRTENEEITQVTEETPSASDSLEDTTEDDRCPDASMIDVVVLQAAGRVIGLKVDRTIGCQDVVIKSLSDNFISIDGIAGASVLGNGAVALMFDVSAIVKKALQPSHPFHPLGV